jgi:uncharacterized membrane protein YczE
VGTLLFALCIGPIAHVTIPLFARTSRRPKRGEQKEIACASA